MSKTECLITSLHLPQKCTLKSLASLKATLLPQNKLAVELC